MYVYMYVCMYLCMYVCMYVMYVCLYIYVQQVIRSGRCMYAQPLVMTPLHSNW